MRNKIWTLCLVPIVVAVVLTLNGCGKVQANPSAEAPPAVKVIPDKNVSLFSVEHPEQFSLATATQHACVRHAGYPPGVTHARLVGWLVRRTRAGR